jgi:lipopolysaccharide/colanic/teichoic acid biosynthesis glycosyltransferase
MVLEQKAAQSPTPATGRRGRKSTAPNEPVDGARDATIADADHGLTVIEVAGGTVVPFPSHTAGLDVTSLARRMAPRPPSRRGLAAKRVVDITGASAALVLLGPILLGTAALIAAVDGSPVLFRQPRAGLNERPFRIYKFRTMRAGADAERTALRATNEVAGGASFKMTNDPRTTRLGRILRRASIDELPQLLNVLQGDMSLVGPRPHPFDDLAGYQPWHHARFAMKPGMTGVWQVSSRRDPDFDRWVELDLDYIRRWSPALDLRVLAQTIPAVLRGEGR